MSAAQASEAPTAGGDRAAGNGKQQPTLEQLETALAEGVELKRWWAKVERREVEVERFDLVPGYPGVEPTWGFFGKAPVGGEKVPVMGVVQDLFWDQPRGPAKKGEPKAGAKGTAASRWMRDQVREYSLGYELRAGTWSPPSTYPELGHLDAPPYLKELSWCPPPEEAVAGVGHRQLYYKRRGASELGVFPPGERREIVDLRRLLPSSKTGENKYEYEWVAIEGDLFSFNLTVGVAGKDLPALVVPLRQTMHAILSADLIADEVAERGEFRGTFGPGFAFRRAGKPGIMASGPDQMQPAMMLQYLRVRASGEVRAYIVAVLPRPTKILNLSIDPLDWGFTVTDWLTLGASGRLLKPLQNLLDRLPGRSVGFDPLMGSIRMLNLLTADQAAKRLCISKEQLEKEILIKHAALLQTLVLGSRQVWDQVPDWTKEGAIPTWIREGELP